MVMVTHRPLLLLIPPLPPRGLDDAQRYRDYREARRGYGYDRGYQRPDYDEDQPRGLFPFFGR